MTDEEYRIDTEAEPRTLTGRVSDMDPIIHMALDLTGKLDALRNLNRGRFEYVLERAKTGSIGEALRRTGHTWGWWTNWTKTERDWLEATAHELYVSKRLLAEVILLEAAIKAAEVKVEALDYKDKRLKQDAASEILDRTIGKPRQPTDQTNSGEMRIVVEHRRETVV